MLHLHPSARASTLALCKAHGAIRHDYFRAMLTEKQDESSGWILFKNVAFIENSDLGVILGVTGPNFLVKSRGHLSRRTARAGHDAF